MTNRLTLTNAGQNSGNSLILLGATFGYVWGNMVRDFPIPGRSTGIIETQFKGWKNPAINITFYIELSTPTTGAVTWTQFNNIIKDATNKTYLQLKFGTNDTQFFSYAGMAAGSTGTSSIPIQIMDYNLQVNPGTLDKLFVTMNCVETK
jgi:hypothetical protein